MSNVMGSAYCKGKVKTTMPGYNDPKKSGRTSGEVRHSTNPKNNIENMKHMPKGKKGY